MLGLAAYTMHYLAYIQYLLAYERLWVTVNRISGVVDSLAFRSHLSGHSTPIHIGYASIKGTSNNSLGNA